MTVRNIIIIIVVVVLIAVIFNVMSRRRM